MAPEVPTRHDRAAPRDRCECSPSHCRQQMDHTRGCSPRESRHSTYNSTMMSSTTVPRKASTVVETKVPGLSTTDEGGWLAICCSGSTGGTIASPAAPPGEVVVGRSKHGSDLSCIRATRGGWPRRSRPSRTRMAATPQPRGFTPGETYLRERSDQAVSARHGGGGAAALASRNLFLHFVPKPPAPTL